MRAEKKEEKMKCNHVDDRIRILFQFPTKIDIVRYYIHTYVRTDVVAYYAYSYELYISYVLVARRSTISTHKRASQRVVESRVRACVHTIRWMVAASNSTFPLLQGNLLLSFFFFPVVSAQFSILEIP